MSDYYTFTGEIRKVKGHTLRQIVATQDLPQHKVKTGDLGGWIEKEGNLQDWSWLGPDCKIYGKSWVVNNSLLKGGAEVYDSSYVSSSTLGGHTSVSNNSSVYASELHEAVRVKESSVVGCYIKGAVEIIRNSRVEDSTIEGNKILIEHVGLSSADIENQLHLMTGEVFKLYRRGNGYYLKIGCKSGTVGRFRGAFKKNTWSKALGLNTWLTRAEMLALCDMLEARIESWKRIDQRA